jgi:hypothetical protein
MWFPLDIVMNEPICTRSRSLVLFQNERLFLFQEKKMFLRWPMLTMLAGCCINVWVIQIMSLQYLSHFQIIEYIPQIEPLIGFCEGHILGDHH